MKKYILKKRKLTIVTHLLSARPSAIALLVGTSLTGCSGGFSVNATPLAQRVDETLGCKNFEESMWDTLNRHVEENGRPPTAAEFDSALKKISASGKRLAKADLQTQALVASESSLLLDAIASALPVDTQNSFDQDGAADQRALWLERLAELEIGDRTTADKSRTLDAVQRHFENLKATAEKSALHRMDCLPPTDGNAAGGDSSSQTTPTGSATSLLDEWAKRLPAAVYGGLKVLSVSYQSCDAGLRAPIDDSTPNVDGISVIGTHPSGTGKKRVISDLKSFLSDHPYLDPYQKPAPLCHEIQKLPLIYDYGGKPYTTTSNDKLIDLFQNAGTGTKELGIDCSAFVFSAYASAGLKMKAESALKARLVNGVSSTMLTDPRKNGLSCLDHATFTRSTSLHPGDIIAIKGHVVMVEHVGRDPFGLARINAVDDCSNGSISISRFDFTLMQSAPEKGGIGINRIAAKDYLSTFSTMGQGLLQHAKNACLAKFEGAKVSRSSLASVVRHSGAANCEEQPVRLAKGECVSSCPYREQDTN